MHRSYLSLAIITTICFFLSFCSKQTSLVVDTKFEVSPDQVIKMESTAQRNGDPDVGRDYLLNGDYVDSGIPLSIYKTFLGIGDVDELQRSGINEGIHHEFNAFETEDGIELAAPNCLQCHSSYIDGQFVLGLGNTEADFTMDASTFAGFLDALVINNFGSGSKEWNAYSSFSRAIKATGPEIVTQVIGANSADKLAAVLASHRNKDDLTWIDEEMLELPDDVVPTDVPAWWLLKKKNAMFYTGVGQGDFARISMASSILTLKDSTKASIVDDKFADVVAYIKTLEAPPYPNAIDTDLAAEGETIFINNCSTCHGTYGENESYPNYIVDLDVVKTDSALVYANFGDGMFVDWYNQSWFGRGDHSAMLVPNRGYVAPPLDGIWASAPYLHNGSVPNLESLLNSPERPTIWRKTGGYDWINVGFEYEELDNKADNRTYDTNLFGYGNRGHRFGDSLSSIERNKLLEYLKTL